MPFLQMKELPIWANGEEIANTLTHIPGIFLSIIGLIFSINKDKNQVEKDPWVFGGEVVLCVSLFILYTSSSCYHGCPNGKLKMIFRYCDHCSIYILIAGTYTPYCCSNLRKTCGIYLLIIIWTIAFFGIFLKIWRFDGFFKLSVMFFVGMGWIVILAMPDLMKHIELEGLYLMFAGGLFYSFGTILYSHDEEIPFFHALWHLFVLGGSIFFYISIYYYGKSS